MKKIYLCLIALCCGYASMSQTEQGIWMVGGNFTLNTADNATTVALTPTAGYFVINNFAVGGTVSLAFIQVGENKTTRFGVGPLTRFYFGRKNVRPFAHGELNFVSNKLKAATTTNTETGINYLLAGGLAAFLNQNVALETIAGYSHTKLKDSEGSGGFELRIGFQVYLHPRTAVEQIRTQ
jgi:hypothetical protein